MLIWLKKLFSDANSGNFEPFLKMLKMVIPDSKKKQFLQYMMDDSNQPDEGSSSGNYIVYNSKEHLFPNNILS